MQFKGALTHFALAAALFLAASFVSAAVVTYEFSGTGAAPYGPEGELPEIDQLVPAGTPFRGRIAYDTSAPVLETYNGGSFVWNRYDATSLEVSYGEITASCESPSLFVQNAASNYLFSALDALQFSCWQSASSSAPYPVQWFAVLFYGWNLVSSTDIPNSLPSATDPGIQFSLQFYDPAQGDLFGNTPYRIAGGEVTSVHAVSEPQGWATLLTGLLLLLPILRRPTQSFARASKTLVAPADNNERRTLVGKLADCPV